MISENDHLLVCLAEECAEVAHRVSKALRFGLEEIQPGQPLTNARRIVNELMDLFVVANMCDGAGLISMETPFCDEEIDAKKAKVEKFMIYAESVGALKRKKEMGCLT